MTTAGITIRRRNRSDGIVPLRTHSYAVDREMPRRCAACSTERVADSVDVMGSRDAADVPDHLPQHRPGRPALLRTIVRRAKVLQARRQEGECMRIAVDFSWVDLGPIALEAGRLRFPQAPEVPGIYRFGMGDRSYIGETDRLRRRFQHYRTPGPTQSTNLRLNALMTEMLANGKPIMAAVVTAVEAEIDGARCQLDLRNKEARLLVESAALVASRELGQSVENL